MNEFNQDFDSLIKEIKFWIQSLNLLYCTKNLSQLLFGTYLDCMIFSDSTSINESLTVELNHILNWITTTNFELNNSWIEFWETNIVSNIELNQFLPKFKLWIVLGIQQGYANTTSKTVAEWVPLKRESQTWLKW